MVNNNNNNSNNTNNSKITPHALELLEKPLVTNTPHSLERTTDDSLTKGHLPTSSSEVEKKDIKEKEREITLLIEDVKKHKEYSEAGTISKIREAITEYKNCKIALYLREKEYQKIIKARDILKKAGSDYKRICESKKRFPEYYNDDFIENIKNKLLHLEKQCEGLAKKEEALLEAKNATKRSARDLEEILKFARNEQIIKEFRQALKNENVSKEATDIIFQNLAQSNFSTTELERIFFAVDKIEGNDISLDEDKNKQKGEHGDRIATQYVSLKIALISCALQKLKLIPKVLIPDNSNKGDAIDIVKKMKFEDETISFVPLKYDEKEYYLIRCSYNGQDVSCFVAQDINQATYILKGKFNKETMKTKKSLIEAGAKKIYWRFEVMEKMCNGKNDGFVFSVAPALILSLLEGRIKKSLEN